MKNILNWTFGSFFRTIGRVACYLIIGGIIAYFMSDGFSNGNFRLTDLFGIQKVSALSLDGNIYRLVEASPTTHVVSLTDNARQDTWTFSNVIQNDSGDYIVFPFSGFIGLDQTLEETSTGSINYIYQGNVYLQISILSNAGGNNKVCEIQNNMIVCPINHNANYYTLVTELNGDYTSSDSEINVDLRISGYPTIYKTDTNSIISSQQQTTNAVNSVNQTITETNSTSDANDTYSFFNSYDNQAESQLTQVISAPLTLLNNLIVGTDTQLCFTLKGKQTCIPSGRMIWGKTSRTSIHSGNATFTPHPFSNDGNITNGISAFVVLFNLVVGGFLSYKMLLSLYRMVDDMLNPTNNRIEVLRL